MSNRSGVDVVVSIDVGGTCIKAGLVHPDGMIGARRVVPTPRSSAVEPVVSVIVQVIEELLVGARGHPTNREIAVVVGVPGVIDRGTGMVVNAFNTFGEKTPDVAVREQLASRTGLTVQLEKDVNLAALGEMWLGALRGRRDGLMVAIGTGIGAALVVDGQLYRGAGGAAAELGHITVEPNGRKCGCGNHGCLEQYASGRALANAAGLPSAERVFEMAERGDAAASEILADAFRYLGIGIATAVTLLNPEIVVIGGGVSVQFERLIGPMRREIGRRCRPYVTRSLSVVRSALGTDSGILGGGRLLFGEEP